MLTVHPSRQFLSRSIPEAELAVSEGVFPTPDFELRTRRWMSGYGYEQTFHGVRQRVRSAPNNGHSCVDVRFAPNFVRFTSRSRPSWWCLQRSAFDPQRTFLELCALMVARLFNREMTPRERWGCERVSKRPERGARGAPLLWYGFLTHLNRTSAPMLAQRHAG